MTASKYVSSVRVLIQQAAEREGNVTFKELFDVFPQGTPSPDVYNTLESACEEIAPWSEAIYSVVLSKKGTCLPGDGFFDIFRLHRSEDYLAIAGDTHCLDLTQEQQEKMVFLEKARVYLHARDNK